MTMIPGCTNLPPEKVVAKFFIAVLNGETDKARNYCTDSFTRKYISSLSQMSAEMPQLSRLMREEKPSVSEIASELVCRIRGNEAQVWGRGAEFTRYLLIQVDGEWKLDDIEVDVEAAYKAIDDMGRLN